MMWIVAICAVLFYDSSMSDGFLIGAFTGVAYVMIASLVRRAFAWCGHQMTLRRWEREREAQERDMSRERVDRERARRGHHRDANSLSEPLLHTVIVE